LTAAADAGPLPVAVIGDEVFQSAEQERTKAANGAVGFPDGVLFQQVREEALSEVFRVVSGEWSAGTRPEVGVDRIPIGAAKPFERGASLGGVCVAGLADEVPVGHRHPGVRAVGWRGLLPFARNHSIKGDGEALSGPRIGGKAEFAVSQHGSVIEPESATKTAGNNFLILDKILSVGLLTMFGEGSGVVGVGQ
jgi:hypothetical protein